MDPFTNRLPDPRLVARLVIQLRFGTLEGQVGAFLAGGDALAIAVLASRGGGVMPDWVDPLADAMVGSLLRIEDGTIDDAPADERLRLSIASVVLSVVRPRASSAVDGAISLWMGWGMGTPRCAGDPLAMLRWTLLRLFLDDLDGAAEAVHALLEEKPYGAGMVLHDWIVARLQSHGPARLDQCFAHLHTLLSRDCTDAHPALLIVAAVALTSLGRLERGAVLDWLDARIVPVPEQIAI